MSSNVRGISGYVYEVGSTILFGIELCSGELLKLNVHFKNCSGLLALNINQ